MDKLLLNIQQQFNKSPQTQSLLRYKVTIGPTCELSALC